MANTINFILTNAAAKLIPKILNGKTLNFTRMAVGDGFSYDTTVAKGFTTLVKEVLSLDITKKEIENSSTVKITSAFTSSDVQKEFYYREVGLFAQDPDTGQEVLYAYGNRNEAAELITPAGSNIVTKQLAFIIFVGDSANVTVKVNADVYALQEDIIGVQADITTLQTSLHELNNTKTDKSTATSLQSQINTLVLNSDGSQNAEAIQARIDINGNVNDVLKTRLDYSENIILNGVERLFSAWESGFVAADGTIESNSNVITQSELQPIKIGETVTISILDGYSYAVSWYNSKKEIARRASTWLTASTTLTNNYSYYRLSILKTGITLDDSKSIFVTKKNFLSVKETSENIIGLHNTCDILGNICDVLGEAYKYLFKKCICIGDSLTRGYYTANTINDDGKLPTYPQILAKISGWECTQAGKSGATAKTWYTDRMPLFDYTDKDIAIIYLGTNGGLEAYSTEETDTTQCGCYRKIIQNIFSKNPNCKIFMCTVSNVSGSTVETTNNTIRLLASEFDNCFVLELKDNGIVDLGDSSLHPYDMTHFGNIGYIAQAHVIANLIKNIVSRNVESFNIAVS